MLIVLAIIGVLASIVISQIANAAFESRRILARQQQVVLQSAVNSWIVQRTATGQSLGAAQTAYNAATTSKAKLDLVGEYLDQDTYSHLVANTSDAAKVQSDAMKRVSKWIEMPDWAAGSYPRVNLLPVD